MRILISGASIAGPVLASGASRLEVVSARVEAGQHVVIVNGLPGTGKTTLGRAISELFSWPRR